MEDLKHAVSTRLKSTMLLLVLDISATFDIAPNTHTKAVVERKSQNVHFLLSTASCFPCSLNSILSASKLTQVAKRMRDIESVTHVQKRRRTFVLVAVP